ncbi:hypothetical protein F4819DRAFT_409389 [Hypoxylon fuscum]|nr:hypothetical protein F4819DRAFT_409389 [Hypoxylon fuscum]
MDLHFDIHSIPDQPTTHFLPRTSSWRPSPSRQSSFAHGSGTAPQPSSSSFVNGNHSHHDNHHDKDHQKQRIAAEQAYREAFASHERAVFQEEVRARARRRDAARNRALFRGSFYKRPEFYAITLGLLGLLYPIINQYIVQPWLESKKHSVNSSKLSVAEMSAAV